jgi:hypothetical protein
VRGRRYGGKSGFGPAGKSLDLLKLGPGYLGQPCPQECPHPDDPNIEGSPESLGAPLSINEVARLIGCSPWTVRHRYLPVGLPYVRIGPAGKLIFYTNQIVRWLLRQQQKGGTIL